jgi:TonB family protein
MRRTLSGLLLSSMLLTAAAYASDDVSASTPKVSTGVTPPKVLTQLTITAPDAMGGHSRPQSNMVAVTFTVDETGQPRNIQILKGSDPYWDARIAAAVQNLHYAPATLNNRPIAMVVNLNINISE